MLRKIQGVLACASIMLTGCATTNAAGEKPTSLFEDLGSGVAMAMNAAMPSTLDASTKTADSGEVLLAQPVGVIGGARLKEDIKANTLPLLGISYKVSNEDLLYPIVTQNFGELYCVRSVAKASLLSGILTAEQGRRACFRDMNDDGSFEQLWGADEASARPSYSSFFITKGSGKDLDPPMEYEKIDGSDMPVDTITVKYAAQNPLIASKRINFQIGTESEDGETASFQTFKSVKVKDMKLPMKVRSYGFEIEILDFDDETDQIEYRVLSNIGEGRPVPLLSPRKPVVVYY